MCDHLFFLPLLPAVFAGLSSSPRKSGGKCTVDATFFSPRDRLPFRELILFRGGQNALGARGFPSSPFVTLRTGGAYDRPLFSIQSQTLFVEDLPSPSFLSHSIALRMSPQLEGVFSQNFFPPARAELVFVSAVPPFPRRFSATNSFFLSR